MVSGRVSKHILASAVFLLGLSELVFPARQVIIRNSQDQDNYPRITTTSLSAGTQGVAYVATIQLQSGVGRAPFTFTVTSGALPTGLTLNSSSGVISGIPSGVGVSTFTIRVVDSLGGAFAQALSLTINASGGGGGVLGSTETKCYSPWYIDWDCDGYGVGVRSTNIYGWNVLGVGDRPDADDTTPFLNTAASVLSAYDANSNGTLDNSEFKTFLSQRKGITADNVFYISPTGNNGTGAPDNPSLPYADYNGPRPLLDAGDVVVYRAGTYTNHSHGGIPALVGGSSTEPTVIMTMPGERVLMNSNSEVFSTSPSVSWLIIDGFTIDNPTNTGLGSGWGCVGSHNTIWRNMETQRFNYVSCVGDKTNLTVERSIFHHQLEHGHYMGCNDNECSGVVVRDNIYYSNGYDHNLNTLSEGYGGYQFNGRCIGCTFDRNISHTNSAWGYSLVMGVKNSTFSNNLAFNNGTNPIKMGSYAGDCALTGGGATGIICPYEGNGNLIINNTFWAGTHRADGNYGSGIYPEPFPAIFVYRDSHTNCVEGGVSVAAVNCSYENTYRNNIIIVNNGAAWRFLMETTGGSPDNWANNSTFQNNVVYKLNATTNIFCVDQYTPDDGSCDGGGAEVSQAFAAFNSAFGGTNINSNPLVNQASNTDYTNPDAFDFRLQSTSPARNAASATGVPTLDFARITRLATHDIGAFEFIGDPIPSWEAITLGGGGTVNQPILTAQIEIPYDPYSQRLLFYSGRNTSSIIYSTDFFAYNTVAKNFTWLGGTGSPVGDADIDGSRSALQPWPGDRHPDHNLDLDTNRKALLAVGGYASICTTCEDYNGSNGTYVLRDVWKYNLRTTPTSNTWTNVCGTIDGSKNPVHCPGTDGNFPRYGSTLYDYINDVIFKMGYDEGNFWKTWVFCQTPVGGGGITSAQTAAGCLSLNTWRQITSLATGEPPNAGVTDASFPSLFMDSTRAKILVFSGNGGGLRRIHEYNVATKVYTDRNPSGLPLSGLISNNPESSYVRITSGPWAGNYLYIRTSQAASGSFHTTYFYDVRANALRTLSITGTGPDRMAFSGWDHGELKVVTSHYPPHQLKSATLLRQN